MNWNNLSPYVRIALDDVEKPGWFIAERSIYDYELLFVKAGEIEVIIEGAVYRGVPGDIFLFKPKQKHSILVLGTTSLRQPHIHFDLFYQPDSPDVSISYKPFEEIEPSKRIHFREDLLSAGETILPNFIRLQQPAYIEKLIFTVIQEFNMKLPYYEATCKGLLILLLSALLREFVIYNCKDMPTTMSLARAQSFLNHHSDQEVTIKDICAITHMSPHHLIRQFKSAYGITPIQYHQLIRMERAKELIRFTSLTISQIADRLGFSNINAFSRAFKKSQGVSPSFFREKP